MNFYKKDQELLAEAYGQVGSMASEEAEENNNAARAALDEVLEPMEGPGRRIEKLISAISALHADVIKGVNDVLAQQGQKLSQSQTQTIHKIVSELLTGGDAETYYGFGQVTFPEER